MSKVRYISLGGFGNVTKNMHVFETDRDIIIIDVGIGFPDTDQYGVDLVIPDVSYLSSRRDKIRGILISHAHEDHIGGVPYIVDSLGNPPIYATKLAKGFLQNKLQEHNRLKGQALMLIDPEAGEIRLGEFRITPYRVNHSVPDALGFYVNSPSGTIVFSPDYKFDWTPVDGVKFDVNKLAQLSGDGVMALFSDCLGSTREGFTVSERHIQDAFENEMTNATGQVFITTMSSNISRMQQAINASLKFNRRVVPVGRSIDQNIQIASNLGYLSVPDGAILTVEEARRVKPHRLTYIIAGSFGQKGSALERLAKGENRQIRLRENAVVIFSADPIPGVADQVGNVIDNLISHGARVVYSEIQDNLHVSGHGSKGDMSLMIGITRPKYFVPIGGEVRHQHAFRELVSNMGYNPNNVFELKDGQTVEFDSGNARLGGKVEVRDVFVDGKLVGDVGKLILSERSQLAEEGVVVIAVRKHNDRLDNRVSIESRGFIFKAETDEITPQLVEKARNIIEKKHVNEWGRVKDELEKKLGSFIYQKIKRSPLIVPMLVN